ncbi:MAG: HlyD family efflux transporter periplasmic adaptor subunit [Pseudomonadota bacterium]|nr:HlyD family efflux transporter periplasmic adaptor subunit [Pseudomonadota bacterium]
MRKKTLLIVLAVIAALAAVALWAWQREHAGDDGQLTLYGNVDIRQIALAFEGSGRVAEMRVEEGDPVAAGQVLATLDTRTAQLRLEQARAQVGVMQQTLLALQRGSRPEEIGQAAAQVRAAEAEAERARLQYERLQATASSTEGRAVGRQDLDNARAQWQAAQAQLDARRQSQRLAVAGPRKEDIARAQAQLHAAEAEAALLQHQLDLSELTAPQAAVVRARLLQPGDMASPQRAAYTLALTDPKWVRVYVPEPQLGRIHPGMAATVTTDSAPHAPVAGRIGFISSVAEFTPKTVQTTELRTDLVYEVRILVDDPRDQLRLGMPATVQIDLTQPAPAAQAEAASASASRP